MENQIHFIKAVLIKIAGYDLETAKNCSSAEINKLAMHGTLVIIPALLGLFTFGYAMYLFSNNLHYAIIGGVVWACIILLIDRAIISSGTSKRGFSASMLGRFLLAVVIGLSVAEPAVLFIFKDSIDEAIHQKFRENQHRIYNAYQPGFDQLNSRLETQLKEMKRLQLEYTMEMDGTGGSGYRNQGPIYQQKFKDYQDASREYERLKSEVKAADSVMLIKQQAEIKAIEMVQAKGLAGRLDTLHSLDSASIKYYTWVLRALFFLLELIPFLAKLSPKSGGDIHDIGEQAGEEAHQSFMAGSELRISALEEQGRVILADQGLQSEEKALQEQLEYFKRNAQQLAQARLDSVMEKLNMLADSSKLPMSPEDTKDYVEAINLIYRDLNQKIKGITMGLNASKVVNN